MLACYFDPLEDVKILHEGGYAVDADFNDTVNLS